MASSTIKHPTLACVLGPTASSTREAILPSKTTAKDLLCLLRTAAAKKKIARLVVSEFLRSVNLF